MSRNHFGSRDHAPAITGGLVGGALVGSGLLDDERGRLFTSRASAGQAAITLPGSHARTPYLNEDPMSKSQTDDKKPQPPTTKPETNAWDWDAFWAPPSTQPATKKASR